MEAPKKLQLNQSTLQTIEHVIAKGLELKKQPANTISKINLKQEEIFTLQPHPQFS
jgi:RAB protein geranylgeranyltransferase component A